MSEDQPIGVGRTAEVYPVGERMVAKVLLPGFDGRSLEIEARKTQAAHDAGVKAPGTHGAHALGGRVGYLFDRIDGQVMLDVLRSRPWAYRAHASLLARLHAEMHGRRTARLPSVKELLAAKIDAAVPLDEATRRFAKDRLLALDDDDAVLHGDYHPGNVMVAPGGPVVIDWLDAARGAPAADVARSLWLMSPAGIPAGTPQRAVLVRFLALFRRRYLRTYRSATALDSEALNAWRVPVLAGRLSEGIGHEVGPLLAELARLVH